MKQTKQVYLTFYIILLLSSCTSKKSPEQTQGNNKKDSLEQVAKMQKEAERQKPVEASDINLKKIFSMTNIVWKILILIKILRAIFNGIR